MPIYEYSCTKCGKVVELLQRMGSEQAGSFCPSCGEDTLVKVFSVTAPAQMNGRSKTCCEMPKLGGCGGCCGGH